jgi:hypothetical protein
MCLRVCVCVCVFEKTEEIVNQNDELTKENQNQADEIETINSQLDVKEQKTLEMKEEMLQKSEQVLRQFLFFQKYVIAVCFFEKLEHKEKKLEMNSPSRILLL